MSLIPVTGCASLQGAHDAMAEDYPHPLEPQILEALAYYGRADLARMLNAASYELNVSSTYGRAYNAYLTSIQIYTDIRTKEQLSALTDRDTEDILKAFRIIHPLKDYGYDLNGIELFVDPELPIPTGAVIQTRIVELDPGVISESIEKSDSKLEPTPDSWTRG